LSYSIEPLSERHKKENFDCGVESLNRYLKQQASQDVRKNVASLYVAVWQESSSFCAEPAGYYSLSNTGILQADIPNELQRKMPRYPLIPAVLLGRLAVDLTHRARGLGSRLLADAFESALKSPSAWALFDTDAVDESARAFYEHFGFRPLKDDPKHLYITHQEIATTAAVFASGLL
jgi:GNAT superfamily N-acetyltransferase